MAYGDSANWSGAGSFNGKVNEPADSLFAWFAAWLGDFWRWLF